MMTNMYIPHKSSTAADAISSDGSSACQKVEMYFFKLSQNSTRQKVGTFEIFLVLDYPVAYKYL